MLSKWLWKLKKERLCLSSRIIYGKYGDELVEDLFEKVKTINIAGASEFIKDLAKVPNEFQEDLWSNKFFKWKVNNGKSVRFWTDWWSESACLKESFSQLFSACKFKFITVCDMKLVWNSNFEGLWSRELSSYELLECDTMGSLLNAIRLSTQEDELRWENFDRFSTKSCVYVLDRSASQVGPWSLIWKLKIPPRIRYFLWQCGQNKIPSLVFLKTRLEFISTQCQRCHLQEETQSHAYIMGMFLCAKYLGRR